MATEVVGPGQRREEPSLGGEEDNCVPKRKGSMNGRRTLKGSGCECSSGLTEFEGW